MRKETHSIQDSTNNKNNNQIYNNNKDKIYSKFKLKVNRSILYSIPKQQ